MTLSTPTRLTEITVNGRAIASPAATLSELLVAEGFADDIKVATAVNGDFVPVRLRAETPLADGDRIEILSARQGG